MSSAELSAIQFILAEEPWMKLGTCRVEHADPSLFILERGHTAAPAQRFCCRCSYRQTCLDYGKRTDSVGVWGGEVLGLSNRSEVELRPLIMLQDARPVEHLINPPPLKLHQNPLAMFKIPDTETA